MSQTESGSRKRIPRSFGDEEELWRGYTLDEFLVGAAPALTALLITAYILPVLIQQFGLPLSVRLYGFGVTGGLLVAGVVLVFATPAELTTPEWLASIGHFIRRPKEVLHVRYSFGMERDQRDLPESGMFEIDQRSQDLTYVDRIHPDADAVERLDDRVYGAVRVEPANMSVTSEDRWEDNAGSFADFVNSSLEFPIQIYSTTRSFPVERYIQHHEDRLADPDVTENPVLEELIEYWLEWYPEELAARGTTIRSYYVITAVSEDDILGSGREQQRITEQLAELPVIGSVFKRFVSSQSDLSPAEKQEELLSTLDERLNTVETEGIRPLTGCDARRVEADELASLLMEFWQGDDSEIGDIDQLLHQTGLVRGNGDTTHDRGDNQ